MISNGIIRIPLHQPHLPHAWAIDRHWLHPGRTATGELVYRAKPYGEKGSDPAAVTELVQVMSEAMRFDVTGFKTADALLAVPPSPGKPGLDLPTVLAAGLARTWKLRDAVGLVRKVKETPQMKLLPVAEKDQAVAGAFGVDPSPGDLPRRVIVIDDLIFSGRTLLEVAKVLRGAGVQHVVALAATRVTKGMA